MDTSVYKEKLSEEKKKLEAELREVGVHNPDVKEDWITRANDLDTVSADPTDVADRTEEWDTRRAELAVLETRWNEVRDALKKISDGTYGVCEVGNEQITPERLDANPAARTCQKHMGE